MRHAERPFWQARYCDFLVHIEEKRVEKLKYIQQNPVRRGLVDKSEEWAWSSLRHYATGVVGKVEIESQWTARRRENRLPEYSALRRSRLEDRGIPAAQTQAPWGIQHRW